MGELTLEAPAKLNLTLDILRRREDGYHDLRMVMQTVSLCDTVRVRETETGAIIVRSSREELPSGEQNLAGRAARAFFDGVGLPCAGVEITLQKRIPVCAGMGGGSADAAAVLRALRHLRTPELPEEALERIGASVGSDVPFCVRGGAALAEGRGERLSPFPALPRCDLVLCTPDFGLSTPELFSRVRLSALRRRPEEETLRCALEAGDLAAAGECLCNVFEEVLAAQTDGLGDRWAEIAAIRETLLSHGALGARMTGSGPTVYGLFPWESAAARSACARLQERYPQTFLAHPL